MSRGPNGERVRTKQVSTYATAAEKAEWEAAAAADGYGELGRWVRAVIVERISGEPRKRRRKAHTPAPTMNATAVKVLQGIGNNINQATRLGHIDGEIDADLVNRLMREALGAIAYLRGTGATGEGGEKPGTDSGPNGTVGA